MRFGKALFAESNLSQCFLKRVVMKGFFAVLFSIVLLGLSGCASVQMQDASLIRAANEKNAIVNFVRPAVFLGDGKNIDIWDGDNFIGSLGAGKMIQHEVKPGKHVFIADTDGSSIAAGELFAGKQSFY